MTVVVDIWAPGRSEVSLVVGGRHIAATPNESRPGWFVGGPLEHGTDYLIGLDGDTRPDPLARWAPIGVHDEARAFDPSTLAWDDAAWTGRELGVDSVIYELHVGTFTREGTLDAAAARLRSLADLGITHVELMPLASFDGPRGWGYDGVLINAVHGPYGGPEALNRFVRQAHDLGLAVILDVVYNLLGPSGNYWSDFGPFFTDSHTTPWGPAVNLDGPGSDDVRRIIIGSATQWLTDYHLDGLRLDAVHAFRDDRALPLLEELADNVAQLAVELGRPLSLIAESDRNDPRTVLPTTAGGLGMTAQWADDVHHALHWLLTGETHGYYADFGSCDAAAVALERGFLHDGRWSSFRGRTHGRPIDFALTPPWRFVASLQTHDQIGNRASGERLGHLVDSDRLAAGALLLTALPYTPMLFMGEEWAAGSPWQYFTSFPDDLGAVVSAGRRSEFAAHGWTAEEVPDPQDPATARRSTLEWSEAERPESVALREWYAALLAWRRGEPGLPMPTCSWAAEVDGRPLWWSVARGPVTAVTNLSADSVDIELPGPGIDVVLWWSAPPVIASLGEMARIALPVGSSAVLRRRDICSGAT